MLARERLAALLQKGGGWLVAARSLALDSRRRLHLVACDGRRVLLLTGGAQDVVVKWLPPAAKRNASDLARQPQCEALA